MKLNTIVTGVFLGCLALAPLSGMTASLNMGKVQDPVVLKAARDSAENARTAANVAKSKAEATKADVRAYVVKNKPASDYFKLKAFDMDNPRFREMGTLGENKRAAEKSMQDADLAMKSANTVKNYEAVEAGYKAAGASYDKLTQGYLALKPIADEYYKTISSVNGLESTRVANQKTIYSMGDAGVCNQTAPSSDGPKADVADKWNNKSGNDALNDTLDAHIGYLKGALSDYYGKLKDVVDKQNKYISDVKACKARQP